MSRHAAVIWATYLTALILTGVVGAIALFAVAWQRGSATFLELDGAVLTVLFAVGLWRAIYIHFRSAA